MYTVLLSKKALKDLAKLKSAGLSSKVHKLVELIKQDSFTTPPSYEKLVGDLTGMYSRRINIQHRLIYTLNTQTQTIKILRMWSHYQ